MLAGSSVLGVDHLISEEGGLGLGLGVGLGVGVGGRLK